MKILIPAYEPDKKMLDLIHRIKERTSDQIVIVDDGSGDAFRDLFNTAENMGCIVLHHNSNLGKGDALKTGIRYIASNGETEGVVCADCDGQHTVDDIMKIATITKANNNSIVLGTREFAGKVPWKSRLGNTITRAVFAFATGCNIMDTQTGLRGYPAGMFDWLCRVAGHRFEYELNILLDAHQAGCPICQVPITTIYENNNKSTHFHPLYDSMRVYLPIIKFSGSSISSAAIDFALLLVLQHLTGNLLVSVVGARACSSLFNFFCNKYLVFNRNAVHKANSLFRYYILAAVLLGFNYMFMSAFVNIIGMGLITAKLITETVLFIASYWFQRRFVFSRGKTNLITGTNQGKISFKKITTEYRS